MKKLLLITGLIILVLSLSACGDENTDTSSMNDEALDTEQLETEIDPTPKTEDKDFVSDVEDFEEVVAEGTLDDCEAIEDKNVKATCVLQVTIKKAKEAQDESVCDSLETESSKQVCKRSMKM
jgi:hypothetical protein